MTDKNEMTLDGHVTSSSQLAINLHWSPFALAGVKNT